MTPVPRVSDWYCQHYKEQLYVKVLINCGRYCTITVSDPVYLLCLHTHAKISTTLSCLSNTSHRDFCFSISPEWDSPSCENNRVKFTYSCTKLNIHARVHTHTHLDIHYCLLIMFEDFLSVSQATFEKTRHYRAILSHMLNCFRDAILWRFHR